MEKFLFNPDWIIAVMTCVYVIATIVICIFNYKSAKACQEQVQEARKQFKDTNRAFITISFEVVRNGLMVLHIQNAGKSIAKNVCISVNQSFIDSLPHPDDRESFNSISGKIFLLGINQSIYLSLGSHTSYPDMKITELVCTITYQDIFETYTEETYIDLSAYSWKLLYNSPLDDIYCEIKKYNQNTKQIITILNAIKNKLSNS